MSKIKPKCLPIPADVREKLSDASTSKIDKIQLAEQIREQYGQSRAEMIRLTGIGNTEYSRGQRILKDGNAELIKQLRENNGSLCETIHRLNNPYYGQYPLRSNVTNGFEILYEDSRTLLYIAHGKAHLRLCWKSRGKKGWNVQEKTYTVDNAPYGVDTVMKLLRDGFSIHSDLHVIKGNQVYGTLKHYVVAAYMGIPIEEIADEKIYFKKSRKGIDKSNICIKNLICDVIPFLQKDFSVGRKGNEIVIICKKNGHVYYTDHEPALYELLNDNHARFHLKSRDGRLAVQLSNGTYEYLYHLVMAGSLYGYPADKDGFAQIMEDFHSSHIDLGKEVDHLDGDVTNNHIENLILVDGADNKRKSALYQKIKLPYFCLWEKHDGNSIRMRCGCYAATKKPKYFVDEIFPIKTALSELQRFVEQINFERVVMPESNCITKPTKRNELEEVQ